MHLQGKLQSLYALLVYRMGAHFHNEVVAAQILGLLHIVQCFQDRRRRHALLFYAIVLGEQTPRALQCRFLAQIK